MTGDALKTTVLSLRIIPNPEDFLLRSLEENLENLEGELESLTGRLEDNRRRAQAAAEKSAEQEAQAADLRAKAEEALSGQSELLAQSGALAEEKGFAQVLWLDGVEKKYVEEVGSMNIMFKIDGKIYTAACTGTVLPGVTRRSCIELLKDWGYEVVEGPLAIADVMKAGHEGKLEEVFGTGTAAVVSPVKELDWKGDKVFINDGKIGPVTQKLYDTMTGMQWGKIPDTKGWIVPVCKG